ncbi:MAG: hypothetical protein U9N60_03250 [Thermodesulfobacteriota bacterium]|nr:hypothetical protein [Thermodesulfobacteriota bacterium]
MNYHFSYISRLGPYVVIAAHFADLKLKDPRIEGETSHLLIDIKNRKNRDRIIFFSQHNSITATCEGYRLVKIATENIEQNKAMTRRRCLPPSYDYRILNHSTVKLYKNEKIFSTLEST